jgi:hypothetical protein
MGELSWNEYITYCQEITLLELAEEIESKHIVSSND